MDKRALDSLAHFCVVQRKFFDRDAWLARGAAEGAVVACAAKYLSMTSWYGYEDELALIAARISPSADGSTGLHREVEAVGFDLPCFSVIVRREIALRLASSRSQA